MKKITEGAPYGVTVIQLENCVNNEECGDYFIWLIYYLLLIAS